MAAASDASGMHLSFGENMAGTSVDDECVRLFTYKIQEILQLDDDTIERQIIIDLMKNGRQSLSKYEDDFVPKTYRKIMDGTDNQLMIALKKYFRQQWETQYGANKQWFISFLQEYEDGEYHDLYERVLIRTAEYGNEYMKDCPLLSIVLQLLFENIDDGCLKNTNVFDDLWLSVTNDGLKSITKYSDYITKIVMNAQLQDQSVLFQALREYYRENVVSSLKQNKIVDRNNLYELALTNVVEQGWLGDMKPIEDHVPPRSLRMLREQLASLHKKKEPSPNEELNVMDVPSVETDILQPPTASTEDDIISCHSSSDIQQESDDECDDLDDAASIASEGRVVGASNLPTIRTNKIFVTGLPKTIPEERLFDALQIVFSTVGQIVVIKTKSL